MFIISIDSGIIALFIQIYIFSQIFSQINFDNYILTAVGGTIGLSNSNEGQRS